MSSVRLEIDLPQTVLDKISVIASQAASQAVQSEMQKYFDRLATSSVRLTRKEASEMLRVSLPTLDRLLHDEKISAERIGRKILISQQSIESYLRSVKR